MADGSESKDAYREQALEEMVGRLADLIDEAHDTHIWGPDDEHPAEGCGYCLAVEEARKLIGGDVFLNHYRYPDCGEEWTDASPGTQNDQCPKCNTETEPFKTEDL